MKILSTEEISALGFSKSEVQEKLCNLEVGQGLEIETADWTFETKPPILLYRWAKLRGIKVSVKTRFNGWLAIRKA